MKKIISILGMLTCMVNLHAKSNNNISVRPEVFFFDMNTHFKNVEIHGSKCFTGIRLEYEYLRPTCFYFGIDFLAAGAGRGFHESFEGISIPKNGNPTAFVEYELKIGYPISKFYSLTTLFLCQGAYVFASGRENHYFEAGNSYLGGGIRYRFATSPTFNPGINLKIFGAIAREEKWRFFDEKEVTHHGSWGGEIGIPLIWSFGCSKKGNFTIEPYFLRLTSQHVQNIYGSRFLFGYQF